MQVSPNLLFPMLVVGLEKYLRQRERYPFPVELQQAMNIMALKLGPRFPKTFDGFLQLMEMPPENWHSGEIPHGLDLRISLLYQGQLTELAEDYLLSEDIMGLNVEDLITHQENKIIQELVEKARLEYQQSLDDGEAEEIESKYAAARRFIVENCFTYPSEIRRFVPHSYREIVQQMYEAAATYDERLNFDNHYWECPACGALNVDANGQLNSVKPSACLRRCPGSTGWHKLERDSKRLVLKLGLQKRTFIPGKEEIRLFDWLRNDVQPNQDHLQKITLYPGVDRYDIRLEFTDGQVWAVDIKDYRDPLTLGKQIKEPPSSFSYDQRLRWTRFFYVVPDYRQQDHPGYCSKAQREAGLESYSTAKVALVTVSQFKNQAEHKLWELE
jgi:hypothetical protein